MNKITGLIAATFAAYHEDGSINTDIIPSIVEKMINDGLSGVFVCGTNGEGPNLTTEERMAIAEAYVKAANKRILVLVHVGSVANRVRLGGLSTSCRGDRGREEQEAPRARGLHQRVDGAFRRRDGR